MSQYYDLGEETLWNPSNGASRLFLRQVEVFEAELGLPSGIGPMEMDECRIDPARLEVFVNTMLAWHRGCLHPVIWTLSEGFVFTVLVLADRAGVAVDWAEPPTAGEEPHPWDEGLLERVRRYGRRMSR
ncbi:DUF6086 family protein [Kitasatospora sp. NPDC004531]